MLRSLKILLGLACLSAYPARSQDQTSPVPRTIKIPGVLEPPELVGEATLQPSSEANNALAKALENAGADAEKMKGVFDGVIRQFPENGDAYSMRVEFLFCRDGNRYSTVLDDISSAIRYFPTTSHVEPSELLPELYALKAKVEFDAGDHGNAIGDLEHAIRLDPSGGAKLFDTHVSPNEPKATSPPCEWNTTALNVLVREFPRDYRVYLFRGLYYEWYGFPFNPQHYAAALVDIQKAIATNPKAGISYYYLGQHIENTLSPAETASRSTQPTEKDRKALAAYSTAIALDQGLVPAYLGRANIHWYLKNSALAVSDYTKAIAIQPQDGKIYNRRAQLYMELGKYGLAQEDFGKAIEYTRRGFDQLPFYQQRGDADLKAGDYQSAIEDSTEAIRLILEHSIPHLLRLKQFRSLYPEYHAVADDVLLSKLHTFAQPGWTDEAFAGRFLETGNSESGLAANLLAEAYLLRGDARWKSGDYKKAIGDYQRVLNGLAKYVLNNPGVLNRWKLINKAGGGEQYIDIRTVDYSENGIVKLWIKSIAPTQARASKFSMAEIEINCATRRINTASVTDYDAKGQATGAVPTSEWQVIVPDTVGEGLFDGLCRQ